MYSTNYPKVAIIILNWNGWKDTIECLESLYRISYPDYEVIVVDNNSQNCSVKKIKEYCKGKINIKSRFFVYAPNNKPIYTLEYTRKQAEEGGDIRKEKYFSKLPSNRKLRIILNEKNFGFTGGNNIAIKYALKALNPDYILLLNNDTVVNPNFLKNLVKFVECDKNIGLAQPKILLYEKPTVINSVGFYLDIFGAISLRGGGMPAKEFNNPEFDGKFFCASGACLLIRSGYIYDIINNNFEFFDDNLFLYYEDVDIGWIARLLNYKIGYCPDSIIFHKTGESLKKVNPLINYYVWKNRIRILIKNYNFKNLIWILPFSLYLEFIVSVITSIYHKDLDYFVYWLKGILWNINNFDNTIKMRISVQSKRKCTDIRIFKYMRKLPIELYTVLYHVSKRIFGEK